MAFPTDPLSAKVELYLGSTLGWTDITDYAYVRDGISISRGRSDESSGLTPSTCRLALNNRDGRFSPRNPTGPYYGVLGRNTPVRVSARLGLPRLFCAAGADTFRTADSAGVSITGDIDLRADARLADWTQDPSAMNLILKFTSVGQFSYSLSVSSSGQLAIFWSADGTNVLQRFSTVRLPRTTGRQAIRATLDVDNGAGGHTATFFYADTMSGTWTQLGDPVVTAGVTSIFDSTSIVKVAGAANLELYSVKIMQGIGGTERANPDFTAQAEGATSFADAAGNIWVLNTGTPVITNRRYRFYGEISAWPQAWDVSGVDVRTAVEAAGIVRRLGQGASPLQGPIQRAVTRSPASTFGYWPMEDAEGSTSFASGLLGGSPMAIFGTPRFAADDTTFIASAALPQIGKAAVSGPVSTHAASGFLHVRCLLGIPDTGDVLNGIVLRVYTTGTAAVWDLVYTTGLTLNVYDSQLNLLYTQGAGFTVIGRPVVAGFELTQNGANVDYRMFTTDYDPAGAGTLQYTNTVTGRTFGAAVEIQANPNRLLDTTVIGHITYQTVIPATNSYVKPLRGWVGETAGRRVERLCAEEGVPFTAYGFQDQSVAMGIQGADTFLGLLAECEKADLGQVFETRQSLGLAYRTRESREYQPPTLALSYGNLSDLAPVEDDQATRNDITVTRTGGSSARVAIDSGPLSIQSPPDGVGRYTDDVELSLASDSQLSEQAWWRAAIGTVDEPRYPSIVARLETAAFASSGTLTDSALLVDVGDLVTVTGTPVWLPPEQIRQHVIGQTETLTAFEYAIDYTCVPATPTGSTGIYDAFGRWSGDGSTLSAGITSTATGAGALSIVTPAGKPLWTSDPADFPLDIVIDGERITLSAIAATASPQSATVFARSVNGVVRAHSAGAALDVADPIYYAL